MSRSRKKSLGKKINPLFFVFCEGETEESYSSFLKQLFRIPIQIKTKVTGQKISDKLITNYKREIQRGVYSKDDKVFLMYDADSADIISRLQAIDNAEILASNPCIELWFLLHFRNQNAYISSDQCIRDLRNLNADYVKGQLNNQLKNKLSAQIDQAVERAKQKNEFENPSSTIYRFIDELEKAKEERLT